MLYHTVTLLMSHNQILLKSIDGITYYIFIFDVFDSKLC